ncbi:MAG: hypothetical protein IJN46_01890 [Lachnospiraceae bacterium]|nr:hypothetical protein [Lachnospiraceae bacterium]
MNKKEPVSLALVIINCACAVIWNINLFVDLAKGSTNTLTFVLHILCAILWDICAVAWVLRYRNCKKGKE